MTTTNTNTGNKTMKTNLNTPFDFSGGCYFLASPYAPRTYSTWVSEAPGRVYVTREVIDRESKTMAVRVTCPGRFDEGFLAVVRFDTRDHMHADVVAIQDGIRAEIVASKARLAESMARLDAEFAAKRAARRTV